VAEITAAVIELTFWSVARRPVVKMVSYRIIARRVNRDVQNLSKTTDSDEFSRVQSRRENFQVKNGGNRLSAYGRPQFQYDAHPIGQ
jgi:hypothetical protein